ncbi:MAG TPA: hypothetical protein VJT08_12190, partial [Terriglobales bacterium]|nr:hypothetical protein [Terriglobales bacterium]
RARVIEKNLTTSSRLVLEQFGSFDLDEGDITMVDSCAFRARIPAALCWSNFPLKGLAGEERTLIVRV